MAGQHRGQGQEIVHGVFAGDREARACRCDDVDTGDRATRERPRVRPRVARNARRGDTRAKLRGLDAQGARDTARTTPDATTSAVW